jgi:hypothetical protein
MPDTADGYPSNALWQAAAFAGRAPSIHNSQPWLWRIGRGALDLTLEHSRLLAATDPDARLAVMSCGTALHHARTHLAAHGWQATVQRFPERTDPDHLAHLRVDGRMPADRVAVRLVEAAPRRYTDRRSGPSAPLDFHKLRSIGAAVSREGADLRLLRPNQIFALAEAADNAWDLAANDLGWQAEVADWIGGERLLGTGIPAAALPHNPLLSTVSAQALHRAGAALISESHHHASVFGVLAGSGDEPADWLAAGEALSAGWLTATELDVSVLPLSIVVEVADSRAAIRRLLGQSGHPYLVLRFAAVDPAGDKSPRTPRLPVDAIIEYR